MLFAGIASVVWSAQPAGLHCTTIYNYKICRQRGLVAVSRQTFVSGRVSTWSWKPGSWVWLLLICSTSWFTAETEFSSSASQSTQYVCSMLMLMPLPTAGLAQKRKRSPSTVRSSGTVIAGRDNAQNFYWYYFCCLLTWKTKLLVRWMRGCWRSLIPFDCSSINKLRHRTFPRCHKNGFCKTTWSAH